MLEDKSKDLASKIESIFNFDQSLPPTTFEESVSAFEDKSNQLMNIPTSEIKTIEDKKYIDDTFKTMINSGMKAFEKMMETVKVGMGGKDLEGYSRFFDSLSMTLERLINFKMKIRDIELMANPEINKPQTNIQNNFFDGKDLAKYLKEIKETSELNSVKVDFKVEDTAFEEKQKE